MTQTIQKKLTFHTHSSTHLLILGQIHTIQKSIFMSIWCIQNSKKKYFFPKRKIYWSLARSQYSPDLGTPVISASITHFTKKFINHTIYITNTLITDTFTIHNASEICQIYNNRQKKIYGKLTYQQHQLTQYSRWSLIVKSQTINYYAFNDNIWRWRKNIYI